MSVEHYENFPVASVLCPPHLRPVITAIYHFARTADDIADEGDAPAALRLADLEAYRSELTSVLGGVPPTPRWFGVFAPLGRLAASHALPPLLLHALLDAFVQDVYSPIYPDRKALLDYCRRSADPIGRLLLHLYAIEDPPSLVQSDAICSALQLINFWQDLSVDGPRMRHYVPQEDLHGHGLTLQNLVRREDSPEARQMVRSLCNWSRTLMLSGASLPLRVPGRAGWELRLVVQGGLRILEKIEQMDYAALTRRPKIGLMDVPVLLWRAWRMGGIAR